ncbi:O-methyltransferase [Paenibacillus sp. y28]|uniref:O-methyltransferase n=1 Tax=Paenibacillus sp. y28 TaxID=3129110 RepID=UPI003016CED4
MELPLARQMDMVFRQIGHELMQLTSGTIFVQIRNDSIGKFGIKHLPLESKDGQLKPQGEGLSESQVNSLRNMAIEALKHKRWTHGEIMFDFTVRQNLLCTSVQFESNYNMSALLYQRDQRMAQ